MAFKKIYRFLKIKFKPAKTEEQKNSYEFHYDIIKGHNEKGEEIRENYKYISSDKPLDSFTDALQGLKPYLTEYCELPKDYVGRMQIRSISISYMDHPTGRKIPGVIISGIMRYKRQSGVLPCNTPYKQPELLTETDEEEKVKNNAESFKLMSKDCFEVIQTLFKEAEKYIEGEREEMEIDFAEQSEDETKEKLKNYRENKGNKGKGVDDGGNIINLDNSKN